MTITVNGVAAGKVSIPVVSGNGQFAAVAEITVTAAQLIRRVSDVPENRII
ncbi:hypothetical protein MWG46_14970 [Escherichia coli]|nr:hypothetical protein [Escherichia coli]